MVVKMAMLAEPRRKKQKMCIDPRGSNWSNGSKIIVRLNTSKSGLPTRLNSNLFSTGTTVPRVPLSKQQVVAFKMWNVLRTISQLGLPPNQLFH